MTPRRAFAAKSASEAKAAHLASATVRIADREGAPPQVGVGRSRQGDPRLTPPAIGRPVRTHRDSLDRALAERGDTLVDEADRGPGRGVAFAVDPASGRPDPGDERAAVLAATRPW